MHSLSPPCRELCSGTGSRGGGATPGVRVWSPRLVGAQRPGGGRRLIPGLTEPKPIVWWPLCISLWPELARGPGGEATNWEVSVPGCHSAYSCAQVTASCDHSLLPSQAFTCLPCRDPKFIPPPPGNGFFLHTCPFKMPPSGRGRMLSPGFVPGVLSGDKNLSGDTPCHVLPH